MKMFLTLLMSTSMTSALMGSCREAKKCCEGKDPDCGVTKADINSIIMDPDDAPCYCDHNCLNMGDCCPDFKDYCGGESRRDGMRQYREDNIVQHRTT